MPRQEIDGSLLERLLETNECGELKESRLGVLMELLEMSENYKRMN